MNKLTRFFLCVALFACGPVLISSAFASQDDAEGRVANSADEIHPLLIGMKVPKVSGLARTDGASFDLNAAIAEKPTILIFYRGGW